MLNIIYANNYFNLYQIVKTSKLKTYDNVKKKKSENSFKFKHMYLDFQGRGTLYRAKIFYDDVGSPRAQGNEVCRHT